MVNLALLALLIKTGSLLMAVSTTEPGIIGNVVEEQADTERFLDDLRRRVVRFNRR
jgi:hypothetical protein